MTRGSSPRQWGPSGDSLPGKQPGCDEVSTQFSVHKCPGPCQLQASVHRLVRQFFYVTGAHECLVSRFVSSSSMRQPLAALWTCMSASAFADTCLLSVARAPPASHWLALLFAGNQLDVSGPGAIIYYTSSSPRGHRPRECWQHSSTGVTCAASAARRCSSCCWDGLDGSVMCSCATCGMTCVSCPRSSSGPML